MRIFFTAAHEGKDQFEEYYSFIYNYLEKKGYQHLSDTLIKVDSATYFDQVKKRGYQGYVDEYNRILTNIKQADIVVCECSFPRLGIGYIIQKALELSKPVVALYLRDHLPFLFAGIKDERFQLVEYTKKNLEKILDETINRARTSMDKRFNFFIRPHLLAYLEKVSKEQEITKSTFIRNLIMEHMRKYSAGK